MDGADRSIKLGVPQAGLYLGYSLGESPGAFLLCSLAFGPCPQGWDLRMVRMALRNLGDYRQRLIRLSDEQQSIHTSNFLLDPAVGFAQTHLTLDLPQESLAGIARWI